MENALEGMGTVFTNIAKCHDYDSAPAQQLLFRTHT